MGAAKEKGMGGWCCSEKGTKSTKSNTDDTHEPQPDKPETVEEDDDFCDNDTMGIIPPEEPAPHSKGWFRGNPHPTAPPLTADATARAANAKNIPTIGGPVSTDQNSVVLTGVVSAAEAEEIESEPARGAVASDVHQI